MQRVMASCLARRRVVPVVVIATLALAVLAGPVGPDGGSTRALAATPRPPGTAGHTGRSGGAAARPFRPAPHPYAGLGTWVDMYSWSDTFTHGRPTFGPADIDTMSAEGVQTLYLQGAAQTGDPGVLESGRLLALIGRAHQRGLRVVVWYMPGLTDLAADYGRLVALGHLPVDGVAVDIESRNDPDIADRNAGLVTLSETVRRALPDVALGAIVLPPSLLEVVNPGFWPDFPWQGIAPYFDAWLPMTYWTGRLPASGYQDGYTYTADSVVRLRHDLGLATATVHPIGGIADQAGVVDVGRFAAAVRLTGCVGGSLYGWTQTAAAAWPELQALRT